MCRVLAHRQPPVSRRPAARRLGKGQPQRWRCTWRPISLFFQSRGGRVGGFSRWLGFFPLSSPSPTKRVRGNHRPPPVFYSQTKEQSATASLSSSRRKACPLLQYGGAPRCGFGTVMWPYFWTQLLPGWRKSRRIIFCSWLLYATARWMRLAAYFRATRPVQRAGRLGASHFKKQRGIPDQ